MPSDVRSAPIDTSPIQPMRRVGWEMRIQDIGEGFWQGGRSLPFPVISDTAGKGAINSRSSLSGFSGASPAARRGLRGGATFVPSTPSIVFACSNGHFQGQRDGRRLTQSCEGDLSAPAQTCMRGDSTSQKGRAMQATMTRWAKNHCRHRHAVTFSLQSFVESRV